MSEIAYVGIGTNIEPRLERMNAAIAALKGLANVLKVSSIYESAPYGVQGQPAFLNAVAAIATGLSPIELYTQLKHLESELGRQKRERWFEREIDFDILFYGNTTIQTPELIIPHADLLNRSFVLIPLQEIAPNVMHPVLMKSVEALAIPFRNVPTEELHIVHPITQRL